MTLTAVALMIASAANLASGNCPGNGRTCDDGSYAGLGSCCGAGSCDMWCGGCTCKARCRSYDTDQKCGRGYLTKSSYPAETNSKQDCCVASCSLHACSAGYLPIANAANVQGASDGVCCVAACSSMKKCPNGMRHKVNASTIKCSGKLGCDSETCCEEEPQAQEEPTEENEGESSAQVLVAALVASAAAAGAATGGATGADAADVGADEAESDNNKKSKKQKSVAGTYENSSGEVVKVSVAGPYSVLSLPCVDTKQRITVRRESRSNSKKTTLTSLKSSVSIPQSPGEKLVRQQKQDNDPDNVAKPCYEGEDGAVRLEVASDNLITLQGVGKFKRKPPSKLMQYASSVAMLVVGIISLISEKYLSGAVLVLFTIFSFALQVAPPGSCLLVFIGKIISLPPKMLKIGVWKLNFRDSFWATVGILVSLLPCIPAFMSNVELGFFLGLVICLLVLLDLVDIIGSRFFNVQIGPLTNTMSMLCRLSVGCIVSIVSFAFYFGDFDMKVTFSVFLSAALVALKGLTDWLKQRLGSVDITSLVPDLDDLTLGLQLPEANVDLQDFIQAGVVEESIDALRSFLLGKLMSFDYMQLLHKAAQTLIKIVLQKAVETARMVTQSLFDGSFERLRSKAEEHMTTALAALAARGLHDKRNEDIIKQALPPMEQLVEEVLKPGTVTCTKISETLRAQADALDSCITKAEYLVGLDVCQTVRVGAWLLKMRAERIATAAGAAKASFDSSSSGNRTAVALVATLGQHVHNIQKDLRFSATRVDKVVQLFSSKAGKVFSTLTGADTIKKQLAETQEALQALENDMNGVADNLAFLKANLQTADKDGVKPVWTSSGIAAAQDAGTWNMLGNPEVGSELTETQRSTISSGSASVDEFITRGYLDAHGREFVERWDTIGSSLDRVCERSLQVATLQEEIDCELETKTGIIGEVTRNRLEALADMYEGSNELFDVVVATYRQMTETVCKARGLHGEVDEVVSQLESLVEQMGALSDNSAALVVSLKANDQQASAEVLEECLDKVAAVLAAPTTETLTAIELLGSQSIEKLFDTLAEILEVEQKKLDKETSSDLSAEEPNETKINL